MRDESDKRRETKVLTKEKLDLQQLFKAPEVGLSVAGQSATRTDALSKVTGKLMFGADFSQEGLKAKLAQLEKKKIELEHLLELAETRAQQADLYSECLAFLRQYNLNKKKPRRQRELIESYNKLALSHGLEPLDFWE